MKHLLLAIFLGLAACPKPAPTTPKTTVSTASPLSTAALQELMSAPDRSEADKALDEGRKPAELLSFLQIAPGMKVAELGAGGGYTAEILARAVGKTGVVYGQNSKFLLERFAEKPWSERLSTPVMSNVVRVDREFDAPLPPEATNLDAVLMILFYHDTVWFKTNREQMNAEIFKALKPGGVFLVVDHNAAKGRGLEDVETLHRIEESVLVEEILKAGFKLESSADFLRNPADTFDWNASPRSAAEKRGTSDRFVLRFVKP
jgi:predicted methyltransferase